MTDASPSGAGPTDERWESLFDDWRRCGHSVIDRVSDRARLNVGRARRGEYGLAEWLDDVRWCWQQVADDMGKALDRMQDQGER